MAHALSQEYTELPIDALTPHPRNPNRGDVDAIHESIEATGFYGAIVVQKSTRKILAGNHRWKAAKEAGLTEVPVVLIDVDDETALKVLVSDNQLARLGVVDDAELAALLSELADGAGLIGTGFSDDDLTALLDSLAGDDRPNAYTWTVKSPIYEPEGEQPPVGDLYDQTRARELELAIRDADLPDDLRAFLFAAASRHVRFDYQTIANYYAHAPAAVQKLMEQSALVIIDYQQAIEQGLVRFHDAVDAAFHGDHEDA